MGAGTACSDASDGRACDDFENGNSLLFKHSSVSPPREGGDVMLETRRGFTMIEMIMVLGLIGIVAAIGGPRVGAALQRRTTASAADQFALTHSLSRSTAIRYARVAQLHIDASTRRFWVDVDTSANGSGQRATIAY